jgi:peptide/nickel transport system substrate-binding protein
VNNGLDAEPDPWTRVEDVNHMVRFKPIAAVVIAAALALTGCSGSAKPPGGGTAGTTADSITIAVSAVPGTFQVSGMVWTQAALFAQATYDSLVMANGDGTVSPSLATKWSYNDAKTELTMTLRSGVKFTDGTPLDAQAAAQNIMRNRNSGSSNASQIRSIVSASAVDPTTLKVVLAQPDPGILPALAKNLGMIQNPASFDKPEVATDPDGSGPYTLDTANTTAGSSYTFVKKKDYWNPSLVHYSKIVIKVLSDPTAMLNGLKAHQFDLAAVGGKVLDPLKGSGYDIVSRAQNYQGLLLFDREGKVTPAMGDVRVRQAINYAFDRTALLKALAAGHGAATTQIFDPDGQAYMSSLDKQYPYDPAKAKKLLAEAGYPKGFTLGSLSTTLFPPTVYTLMKQQLADVGITLDYTDVGTNFAAQLFSGKYSAGFAQIPIEAADWGAVSTFVIANATGNPFHVADPKIAGWVQTIRTGSEADGKTAYQQLNKYIVDQAWFAPIYRIDTNYATNSKVTIKLGSGNIFPNLWTIQPKK